MAVDKSLDEYIKALDITLTSLQYNYVDDVINGKTHVSNFSVAGSGKSLCLEIIKGFLGDKCIVCASTGISNSILFNNKGGDGTLCRVMSIPTTMYSEYNVKKVGTITANLLGSSDLVTHIFVEEAGMCNPDQIDLLFKRVARYNRAYRGKRSKRNIKVILQGDFLQLPNIVNDADKVEMNRLYGGHTLYGSSILKEHNFSVHIFTEVLRTNDKTFQAALDVLRYAQEHRYTKCLQWLNKRYVGTPPKGLPVIATTNAKVDEANRKIMEENPNPPFVFRAVLSGNYDMKNCPADEDIILKEGCPVITLINDQSGNFSNGSYGHVTSMTTEGVYVLFKGSGEEHFVPIHEFEEKETYIEDVLVGEDGVKRNVMKSKVVGTCHQLCVKVAGAFSVFRMQGRTLDVPAVVDLGWGFPESQENEWGFGQCYTALSRFSDVNNIYLSQPLTKKHIKPCREALNWINSRLKG